jgi:hypothetical protein
MSSDSPIYEAEGEEDLALSTFHKSVLEYLQEDGTEEDEWEEWL